MPVQTAMSCLGYVSNISHMASSRRAALYSWLSVSLNHGSSYFSIQQTAMSGKWAEVLHANDSGDEDLCTTAAIYLAADKAMRQGEKIGCR